MPSQEVERNAIREERERGRLRFYEEKRAATHRRRLAEGMNVSTASVIVSTCLLLLAHAAFAQS